MRIVCAFVLVSFTAMSSAQVVDAPLPNLQSPSGPSLEATQKWIVEKLKSLPDGERGSLNFPYRSRVRASFNGCSYVYYYVEEENKMFLRYEFHSGKLEDIIVEKLPQNASSFNTQPKAKFQRWGLGSSGALPVSDLGPGANEKLWEMSDSALDFFTKAPGYSTDVGPYVLHIEDSIERGRIIRAFQHLGKLCAELKANRNKPLQFVPPPGEPF